LEARNIDLNEPDERSFIVYSEADFAARKARMGRNPATGEAIQIKAKRVVRFRVAKACKDAILG
jgi:nucleoid DNA-binding protein